MPSPASKNTRAQFTCHCEVSALTMFSSYSSNASLFTGRCQGVSLATAHSDSKIETFLKLAQSFIFNLRKEPKPARCDVATVPTGNDIAGDLSISEIRNWSVVTVKILESQWGTCQGAAGWRSQHGARNAVFFLWWEKVFPGPEGELQKYQWLKEFRLSCTENFQLRGFFDGSWSAKTTWYLYIFFFIVPESTPLHVAK